MKRREGNSFGEGGGRVTASVAALSERDGEKTPRGSIPIGTEFRLGGTTTAILGF